MINPNAKLAAEGAFRAAFSADSASPRWTDLAVAALEKHAPRLGEFMTEDIAAAAEADGLPLPPDSRAWGAVTMKAKRRGLIRFVRFSAQKRSTCHGSPKSVWASRD